MATAKTTPHEDHEPSPAPMRLHEAEVRPEWVDYNGHMSEAYYVLVFGHTTDGFLDAIGMDAAFREHNKMSLYTLEAHISYLKEVSESEPLVVETQLLDCDHKRLRLFHYMRHGATEELLATAELMLLNVHSAEDTGPRSAPFAEEVSQRLRRIEESHKTLSPPEQAGRSITL